MYEFLCKNSLCGADCEISDGVESVDVKSLSDSSSGLQPVCFLGSVLDKDWESSRYKYEWENFVLK